MSDSKPPRPLSKRDLWLLPTVSLLTIIFMLSGAEIAAQSLWPYQEEDHCRVFDPSTGMLKYTPNCHSRTKVAEGPWVDNYYNDCGYRSRESCGRRPPGSLRVAVLGTSFSYGFMTAYQDAYTTLASEDLTKRCGRPVQFQNLGVPNYTLLEVYRRSDEALALHPDFLLLAINPIDVRHDIDAEAMARRNIPPQPPKGGFSGPPPEESWFVRAFREIRLGSRAVYMAQHFLYQDPETYLNIYLLYGDNKAGFVRSEFSPLWRHRFENLDMVLKDLSAKAQKAGVPLAIFLGPQPAQVALVNTRPRAGDDPFAFARMVTAIASKYGIKVIDPLPAMVGQSDPMSLYYVVDGHLQKPGQIILAKQLERGLMGGGYAPFAECMDSPSHNQSAASR